MYEPIVVEDKFGGYKLADFQQLLLAYSHIYAFTLNKLDKVEAQSKIATEGFRDLQDNYTRLLQNEKMIALGQLVAGIAHEINNPVNFIAGNVAHAINYSKSLIELNDLYKQYYPQAVPEIENFIEQVELEFITEDFPNLLTSMKLGCERIQQIIVSLRNFSRLDDSERNFVDIHEGIDSTLIILQSRIKSHKNSRGVSIIKEYNQIPSVECYGGLLNQVFMNIIANAIDALGDTPIQNPSIIRIRTELADDEQVIIRIIDNAREFQKMSNRNYLTHFLPQNL